MITHCKINLEEIKILLMQLKEEQYIQPIEILSSASIGQHIRHILEFYICLLKGYDSKIVNYDGRERNLNLETDIGFAINEIDKINQWLNKIKNNSTVTLNGNFSSENSTELAIASSLYRELAYCFEHSIHHQALIKIGLKEQGKEHLINNNFGVAPATIRFKTSCAQ
jgi:hypothetical protein